jgi:molybdenum cofactor cytidylyltransferase
MIWAVVLAAGESRRMGKPKMLLPFGEKTILESVLDTILATPVQRIMVVLGAEREKISSLISQYPVEKVFNPDFRTGMLSSVQAGFSALPPEAEAAMVFLGDQPFVSADVVAQVCEASVRSPRSIILPVFGKRRGHPVLIPAGLWKEIDSLSPEVGLRELIHRHGREVLEVAVEEENILMDIDDPQDYRDALNKKT